MAQYEVSIRVTVQVEAPSVDEWEAAGANEDDFPTGVAVEKAYEALNLPTGTETDLEYVAPVVNGVVQL